MKLLDFIGKSQEKQFVIPIYQRVYSWEKEQCKQLWDDIIKTGGNDQIEGHFIGSIIFVHDGIYTTNYNELLIIDGQQRFTTITLLFIALRNYLNDEDEFLEKFSHQKSRIATSLTAMRKAIKNSNSSSQSLIKIPCYL